MNTQLLLDNLLSPPILFFALGVFACLAKSDLEFPQPLPKLFSLYLLFAIGFKGGLSLSQGQAGWEMALIFGGAILFSALTPLIAFYFARMKLDRPNAAAIAATYGSVSAVTFITATSFLDSLKTGYSGYMVAALAIMESPAIITGILLAKGKKSNGEKTIEYKKLFHEAFLNSSVLLLLGSMVIGFFSASHTIGKMLPFTQEIFYGVLCFFLLEMGIVASKRLDALKKAGVFPIFLALAIPIINAALAVVFCWIFKIGGGNAFLFITLAASASYIAVPAAMRLALPEANPSFYVPMALAVTFPFNITLGMAIYYYISTLL